MYTLQINEFKIVSFVITIACLQTKLAPDKLTLWQKYDHSNLFHSLHVGLIKPSNGPSTLHSQFSYDLTNLM